MKAPKIFGVASLAVAVLAILAGPYAHSQAQGPNSVRVARLSRADGQVLILHSGSNEWEEAPANLPLQEGDSLATQSGFAEIEFDDGTMAYLAENSVLRFTQLGFVGAGHATQLTVSQGAGTFSAIVSAQDTFIVHTLTFDVAAAPEHTEFRIDGFNDGAAVEVTLGSVHVSTTKGSTDLKKGQSIAAHQDDFNTNPAVGMLPSAEDAFDQLVTAEGERIRSGNKNTLSYVNSPNAYGLSDLAIYGNWLNLPVYGFTWRPFSVGLTWTPYLNGKWILDPRLGWIWVSNEAWGWMPYHYGSWLLSPAFGWVWVPGAPGGQLQWEPARVNWVQLGNRVGWVAKSPEDREGAPANLKQGVITLAARPSATGNEPNRILAGKEISSVTPIEHPPMEFAPYPAPKTLDAPSGMHSTARATPSNGNSSIVYDRNTHTYIQRDLAGDETISGSTPAGSAPPMPGRDVASNSRTEVPRVPIPTAGQVNSRVNRLFLPGLNSSRESSRKYVPEVPPYGNASSVPVGSGPANTLRPARPSVATSNSPIRSTAPPVSTPPVAPNQLRGNPGIVSPSSQGTRSVSQGTRSVASQPQAQHPTAARPVKPGASASVQPGR